MTSTPAAEARPNLLRVSRIPASPDRATIEQSHEQLADMLMSLVMVAHIELASASAAELEQIRTGATALLAAHGDDLQFGGRRRGATLAALAKAVALLARSPAGFTGLGIHACASPHTGCVNARG